MFRAAVDRLAEKAADLGRPVPAITGCVMVAMEGDPTLPDPDNLVRRLTDPDGMFGIPPEAVGDMVLRGDPAEVAGRIEELRAIGAERVVVSFAAGDWHRQTDLLAEAATLVA
jgi:alkanesulfonate monooxygenase SsuD/methylene tetrahydromethanopterin reductase-like flavin-dependent oxidoreductase (luciferase family)